MAERDFKGIWIPKEVWLDGRLSALDKIILMEIDSCDIGESGCFKSNKTIADFCQCSETKVSLTITRLTELGYIYTQGFDGRRRELKSNLKKLKGRLSKSERQTLKNLKADSQNLKANNINNTLSKKERDNISPNVDILSPKKSYRFSLPTVEEVREYCRERNNGIDADNFCDFYSSKGWMVGKNKMKDWKAAVRTWERGERKRSIIPEQPTRTAPRKSHIEIIDGEEVTVFE